MSYPYKAARYQYGPRKGTLGLCLHMSEGGDGLVDYLANDPARGVSANFALLSTGVMWRMTPYETASGSLNPADRSTDKAYYGHSTLVDVLGDHWTDPNTWVISLEIAGHAADGPNPRQVDAIQAWAADMKTMFPTLRGAIGHADQTNTKGCPGVTTAMKSAFDRIGGHGLWQQETDVTPAPIIDQTPKIVTANTGHTWRDLDGTTVLAKDRPALAPRLSPYGIAGGLRAIYSTLAGHPIVIIDPATAVPVPVATPDCTAAVKAEHDRVKAAAVAAVGAL
jgi:hypothetical protein